jgi:hypothetical protein
MGESNPPISTGCGDDGLRPCLGTMALLRSGKWFASLQHSLLVY